MSKNQSRQPQTDYSGIIFGKVPPQSPKLEEAVLGAIMMESHCLDRVADIIKPEFFYIKAHQLIYEAILLLDKNHMPIDLRTVVEELMRLGSLEVVGGAHYLAKLTNDVVSSANVEAHARIVAQKFMQREVIRVAGEMIAEAYSDSTDVFDLLDSAETKTASIKQMNTAAGNMMATADVIYEVEKQLVELSKRGDTITGISTTIGGLDRYMMGLQPGELTILSATPGCGKTALVIQMMHDGGKKGVPSLFFCLEVGKKGYATRLLSRYGINKELLSSGRMLQGGQPSSKYMVAQNQAAALPITVDFLTQDINQVCATISLWSRRVKATATDGKMLVVVDSKDFLTTTIDERMGHKKNGHFTQALKKVAKRTGVHIVILWQQKEEAIKLIRWGFHPGNWALDEGRQGVQDADNVVFMWRPHQDEIQEQPEAINWRRLGLFKCREGELPFGYYDQLFDGSHQTFTEHQGLQLGMPTGVPMDGSWTPYKND